MLNKMKYSVYYVQIGAISLSNVANWLHNQLRSDLNSWLNKDFKDTFEVPFETNYPSPSPKDFVL